MTKSLPKIIKSPGLLNSEDVVIIPDDKIAHENESGYKEELSEQADGSFSDQGDAQEEKSKDALQKAQEEKSKELSKKILQNAREEREKILQSARSEADSIREEAYRDAYSDVAKEKTAEINSLLDELKSLMSTLSRQQQEFFQEYEKGITELSVDIAQKVVKASVAQNVNLMTELVNEAVSAVRNADWISIEVSSRLPTLAEQLRNELSLKAGFTQATEVIAKDVPEGTCVIRTPSGVVDASISQQFQNLNTILESEK